MGGTKLTVPCAFCGSGAKLSAGHIFPDWMNRAFSASTKQHFSTALRDHDLAGLRPGHIGKGFSQTVKAACTTCDNGWMSQLDAAAQEELSLLHDGVRHGITARNQRRLAAWTVKTSLHVAAKDPRRLKSHYREMWAGSQPPPRTQVWVGCFARQGLSSGVLHHFLQLARFHGDLEPGRINGYGTTIVIGHALLQVVGHDLSPNGQRAVGDVLAPALTAIWPVEREVVPWPPQLAVAEQDLAAISHSVIPGHTGSTFTIDR